MKNVRYISDIWLTGLLLLAGLLATGCSDEPEPDGGRGNLLQIGAMTRSGGEDLEAGTAIQMLLVSGTDNYSGLVTYEGNNEWNSAVYVKGNETYQVYGFMPSSIATSSSVVGNTLYLNGFSPLSKEDVCLVIGARESGTGDVEAGEFSYTAHTTGQDSISLLMGHIFAAADFRLTISADYNQLRTIKLKELKLKMNVKTRDGKMNASAVLTSSKTSTINPFTVDRVSTEGDLKEPEVTLWESAEGYPLEADKTLGIPGYFEAGNASALLLVSTYDVYDKEGHKLHSRTAENQLADVLSGIKWGQRKALTLTVNPTYLYVLSDPDLDNPTVVVSE